MTLIGGRTRLKHYLILVALTLASLALHFVVTDQVGRSLPSGDEDGEGGTSHIKRMEAAYVNTVSLSVPILGLTRPQAAGSSKGKAGRVKKKKVPPADESASKPEDQPDQPQQESPQISTAADIQIEQSAESTQVAENNQPSETKNEPVKGPTFEWPKATKVSYSVKGYYRGPVTGSGSVEWLRTGSKYQVHLDFRAGAVFSNTSSSEGLITPDGLYSKRNESSTTVLFSTKLVSIDLGDDEITLSNGNKVPRPTGVQDLISNVIQLAYEYTLTPSLLEVGKSIEKQIVTKDRVAKYKFTVIKEDLINSPMGPLKTFHVKPAIAVEDDRPRLDLDVWFAPELQYLPVRIIALRETGPKANHFSATLEMERPPQQVGASD